MIKVKVLSIKSVFIGSHQDYNECRDAVHQTGMEWLAGNILNDITLTEHNIYYMLILFQFLFLKKKTTLNSRITKWKDLTVAELKVFIGLKLHTGTIVLPRLQDYWKTHRLVNILSFRLYISRDRFLIILRCLHFSKVPTPGRPESEYERNFKVQLIIDYCLNWS